MNISLIPGEVVDVFVPYRARAIPCQATVNTVRPAEVTFSRPSRHRVFPPLCGGEIHVQVKRRDGAYRLSGQVERWNSQELVLKSLHALPKEVDQKRRFVRTRLCLDAELSTGFDEKDRFVIIEDISACGARISTDFYLDVGTKLLLRTKIEGHGAISIGSRVVRRSSCIDNGRAIHSYGLFFSDINQSLQACLVRYVNVSLIRQKNTFYVALDKSYEDYLSSLAHFSGKNGSYYRNLWQSFRKELEKISKNHLRETRMVIICSKNLHIKIRQACIGDFLTPTMATAGDFSMSMEEAARVEVLTGLT